MKILTPLVLLLLALPDIAPNPRNRSGVDLAPGEVGLTTEIAMRAEVVELILHDNHAEVRAVFDMEHTGSAAEELEVGFPTEARPIEASVRDGLDYRSPFSEFGGTIYAFVAKVDGVAIEAERKTVNKDDPRRVHRHWVCWQMRFEPGQKRRVEVSYEVETKDALYIKPRTALQPRELIYVLKTGAGWKDVIGSARVLLRPGPGFDLGRIDQTAPVPTAKRDGEWEWLFENFEPDTDISVRYRVYRDAEDAVASITAALVESPDDAELVLDLAENQVALGQHVAAASLFARLADWKQGPGRRLPKHVSSRLYDLPAAYLAARSHAAAGEFDKAQRFIGPGLRALGQRIGSLERRIAAGHGGAEDRQLLEQLIGRRTTLELLRR